jgi:hypothetical protein
MYFRLLQKHIPSNNVLLFLPHEYGSRNAGKISLDYKHMKDLNLFSNFRLELTYVVYCITHRQDN